MPWVNPSDPVSGTVITVAYAVANIIDPIRWLRAMTGNADPPGSSFALISTSTTSASWRHIPPDALEAGAAVGNIGYTPANQAGDTFTGTVTAPTVRASGTTSNAIQSSGGVQAAGPITTTSTSANSIVTAGGISAAGNIATSGSMSATGGYGAVTSTSLASSGVISTSSTSANSIQTAGGLSVGGSAGISGQVTVTGNVQAGTYSGGSTTIGGVVAFRGLNVGANGVSSSGNIATSGSGAISSAGGISTAGGISAGSYSGGSAAAGNVAFNAVTVGAGGLNAATYVGGSTTAGSPSFLGLSVGTGGVTTTGVVRVLGGEQVYSPSNPPPAGGLAGVPSGLIAFIATGAVPTGWSFYTPANGRVIVAAGSASVTNPQTFTVGTNYGGDWSHAHGGTGLVASVSGSATGGSEDNTGVPSATNGLATPGGENLPTANHTHSLSGVTFAVAASGNVTGSTQGAIWIPPSHALNAIRKD